MWPLARWSSVFYLSWPFYWPVLRLPHSGILLYSLWIHGYWSQPLCPLPCPSHPAFLSKRRHRTEQGLAFHSLGPFPVSAGQYFFPWIWLSGNSGVLPYKCLNCGAVLGNLSLENWLSKTGRIKIFWGPSHNVWYLLGDMYWVTEWRRPGRGAKGRMVRPGAQQERGRPWSRQ